MKVLHNCSGSFGRSGDGIFCCDGRMLSSVVVIVCHINGKASAGELSWLGSIVLRSLIAGSKLLICSIGSRDFSDRILRPANRNGKTSCLCAKEPKCRTL